VSVWPSEKMQRDARQVSRARTLVRATGDMHANWRELGTDPEISPQTVFVIQHVAQ
jgi:hypothetical protein